MRVTCFVLALVACAALWQLVEMAREVGTHSHATEIERVLAGVK